MTLYETELSEEHRELRDTVARFAREVVAPVIGDHYLRGAFPYEIVTAMGEIGLFGLPIPEDYGGMGGDYLALGIALEELARVDSSVAITLEAAVGLGAMPIFRFGDEAQKQAWLPDLCAGNRADPGRSQDRELLTRQRSGSHSAQG